VSLKVPATVVVSKAEAILIVSALVLSVPILIVLPEVPVPILTVPVVPESKVMAEVVVDLIVPSAAKVKAVAEVVIVSIEATPVKAPPVVTFNPPLEAIASVPVALPIVVFPVPVPKETAPEPLTVKPPDA